MRETLGQRKYFCVPYCDDVHLLTVLRGRKEPADTGFVSSAPVEARLASPSSNTGARIKISRNFMWWKDPLGKHKPWLDIGAGLAADMDTQRLQPVARIKIRDLISIKVCQPPAAEGLEMEMLFNHF